jgi:hypothetical protein
MSHKQVENYGALPTEPYFLAIVANRLGLNVVIEIVIA